MTDLNFEGLMNIGEAPPPNTNHPGGNWSQQDDPGEDSDNQQFTYELNRLKKRSAIVLDSYKHLQRKKKITNTAKTKLIMDAKAGDAELKALLLDAVDIIGVATHDTAFIDQVKRDLNDKY